jgi:hypothetical protein
MRPSKLQLLPRACMGGREGNAMAMVVFLQLGGAHAHFRT